MGADEIIFGFDDLDCPRPFLDIAWLGWIFIAAESPEHFRCCVPFHDANHVFLHFLESPNVVHRWLDEAHAVELGAYDAASHVHLEPSNLLWRQFVVLTHDDLHVAAWWVGAGEHGWDDSHRAEWESLNGYEVADAHDAIRIGGILLDAAESPLHGAVAVECELSGDSKHVNFGFMRLVEAVADVHPFPVRVGFGLLQVVARTDSLLRKLLDSVANHWEATVDLLDLKPVCLRRITVSEPRTRDADDHGDGLNDLLNLSLHSGAGAANGLPNSLERVSQATISANTLINRL